jgi:NAD(P)-dependent dehydrogenase (short-subunit alcohol dehydrogenase family)
LGTRAEQRTAIVTGASSGIGAATCRRLAADGWTVVATARRTERLDALVLDIGGIAVRADMSDPREIQRLVQHTVDACGRVDGLVLAAGVTDAARVLDMTAEAWHRTMAINLHGPFMLMRAALPWLLQARGAIVAVASIGSELAGVGSGAYGASKAALARLTRSVAVDYGPDGIRANTLSPGWIRTEMADAEMDALVGDDVVDREAAYQHVTRHTPSRRPGTPEEVAAAIAWLLSSEAAYVNGSVITIDGGTSAISPGTIAFMART